MSSLSDKIAEVLSSKTRVKILKLLCEYGSLNISAIVRLTRLNHKVVKRGLQYLVEQGVVYEVSLGRVKTYRLNSANPIARVIRELFTS